jgi:hypothetical protein
VTFREFSPLQSADAILDRVQGALGAVLNPVVRFVQKVANTRYQMSSVVDFSVLADGVVCYRHVVGSPGTLYKLSVLVTTSHASASKHCHLTVYINGVATPLTLILDSDDAAALGTLVESDRQITPVKFGATDEITIRITHTTPFSNGVGNLTLTWGY